MILSLPCVKSLDFRAFSSKDSKIFINILQRFSQKWLPMADLNTISDITLSTRSEMSPTPWWLLNNSGTGCLSFFAQYLYFFLLAILGNIWENYTHSNPISSLPSSRVITHFFLQITNRNWFSHCISATNWKLQIK